MKYYRLGAHSLCAWEALPYEEITALPRSGEILFLFAREMLTGRETFPVTDAALLTEKEGVQTLCAAPGPEIPADLAVAIRSGRVRAVNRLYPRWQELLSPLPRKEKYRVNLLGLGTWALRSLWACVYWVAMLSPPSASATCGTMGPSAGSLS